MKIEKDSGEKSSYKVESLAVYILQTFKTSGWLLDKMRVKTKRRVATTQKWQIRIAQAIKKRCWRDELLNIKVDYQPQGQ